jgi:hypothetical protein
MTETPPSGAIDVGPAKQLGLLGAIFLICEGLLYLANVPGPGSDARVIQFILAVLSLAAGVIVLLSLGVVSSKEIIP